MENNRFFLVVQRINSLILLLILLGGGLLLIAEIAGSSRWRDRDEVLVAENGGETARQLRVGSLVHVNGHDVDYLPLESRERGGKFASGSYGYDAQTRNLLFLRSAQLSARWLFKGNGQWIRSHRMLTRERRDAQSEYDAHDDKLPTLALYYEIVHGVDSEERWHDEDLAWTIALSRPDGSGYREIEQGVRNVIQSRVLEDGETLQLLLQEGPRLVVKRYSLRSFAKLSENELASLADSAE